MEIGKRSLFQGSVPNFQVCNSLLIFMSAKFRSRAALNPVASEMCVWEHAGLRRSVALTSIFQKEFFLPDFFPSGGVISIMIVRVRSAVMARIMFLALWPNLILRVTVAE
jgi:hypothetical protein